MAGVLRRAAESAAFTNPTSNSYDRLGHFEAPRYIAWARQNRSALIRIPAVVNDTARMELRSPDPSVNPYLVLALMLAAGLDGIEQGLALPAPVSENLFTAELSHLAELSALPSSLGDALELAKSSRFAASVLGQPFLDRYIELKSEQWHNYLLSSNKSAFCDRHFFRVI